jgi:hypothetical protein
LNTNPNEQKHSFSNSFSSKCSEEVRNPIFYKHVLFDLRPNPIFISGISRPAKGIMGYAQTSMQQLETDQEGLDKKHIDKTDASELWNKRG